MYNIGFTINISTLLMSFKHAASLLDPTSAAATQHAAASDNTYEELAIDACN